MSWTTRTVALGSALMPAVGVLNTMGGTPERRKYVVLTWALALVPLTLATLVARRVPGNACAVWVTAAGVALVVTAVSEDLATGVLAGLWMLLYLPFGILLLVVPTGHVRSRRWALVGYSLTVAMVAYIALCAASWLLPEPSDSLEIAGIGALPLFLFGLIACAAAPVARYRRADPAERIRLRWVFLGATSLPLALMRCRAGYIVIGAADLVGFGLIMMYLAIPTGVAVALVRAAWIDIDRASIATVTAGALSAATLVVLTIVCLRVGSALVTWSPPVAVGLTAGLAAAAAPSYRPLYVLFDRLVFPDRGRAIAALRCLQALVDVGLADAAEVESTRRESLQDPALEVAYRALSDGALLRLDGRPVRTTELNTPVRLHGDVIGALTPDRGRPPVIGIAKASAPLIERARLQAELQAARADTAASRERLVRVSFTEQRRLEHDLHDAAQQQLVALDMRLRVLQRSGGMSSAASDELDVAVAEVGTAVAELRRLAHGVRPSALDDGLATALSEIAARLPDVIELDVRSWDLPDDAAATAYFIVSEAVANALKHAEAELIRVVVGSLADRLRITVTDDGRGGVHTSGGPLRLTDRVAALGGTLSIASLAGAGTQIEAVLPCA